MASGRVPNAISALIFFIYLDLAVSEWLFIAESVGCGRSQAYRKISPQS